MNRISLSMTMSIPLLFALSLVLAYPASAAPPGTPESDAVAGACTGSVCLPSGWRKLAPGVVRVAPLPLRPAPVVPMTAPGAAPLVWGAP
ncbi:hypothetical protein [Nocardia sp. NPDC050710]|uniref:hypothetical protein n=1 Tax=Nocardia sp. NPDC050710 TaxID=3157220 RepID=UPI0033F4F43A